MTTVGRKLYKVTLTEDERTQLQDLVDRGKGSKERRKRAHILLLADTGRDRGGRIDADIADALGVNVTTVERVRKRCVMAGLDAALDRKPHPNPRPRLLDGDGEATLTMLACSQPPAGQASWTLALLGDRLMVLNVVDTISKETVRRTCQDFAELLQDLVADDFPNQQIVFVMDHLNTHKLSVLYDRYEPAVARIARQIAVHQPKPGSWLNIAEIAIKVLTKQCLARRLPDRETMVRAVTAWQNRRNEATKSVDWRFTTEKARLKLKSLYPAMQ